MEIEVLPYTADCRAEWDALVDASCNGTFLHRRDFMEYHAHRFTDASLMLRDERGVAMALFPANVQAGQVTSHGGLSYGGLLYSPRLRQAACLTALECVLAHYGDTGATKLLYKVTPQVFRRVAGEEDLYALFRCGARLVRRDVSTVVDLRGGYQFTKGRTWSVGKGRKAGISLHEQRDPAGFHQLLACALQAHGASPVHSLDELQLLMGRFPTAIRLHEARLGGELLAGALIFDLGHVVHTQYLATSPLGRELGALDFLVAELMRLTFAERSHFSFGISTEDSGRVLNEGLIAQKEGFGGVSRCHDFYEIDLC